MLSCRIPIDKLAAGKSSSPNLKRTNNLAIVVEAVNRDVLCSPTMSAQVIIPEIVSPISLSASLTALTAERKSIFISKLEETGGNVTQATRAIGLTRQWAYQWRDRDADFAQEWDNALEGGTEHLEERLYVRACDIDTTAAIFLLKARRPEKYREVYKVETEQADPAALAGELFTLLKAAAERARLASLQAGPQQPVELQQLTSGPSGPTSKIP